MSGVGGTRVVVVGHVEWVEFVTVDRLPRAGDVAHSTGLFARAAGGGGVVAAVLSELGAEVEFFTALGRDSFGEQAAGALAQHGVTAHVAWRDAPTRRAVTLLERDGGERTIITIGDRLDPFGSDPLPWERIGSAAGAYLTAGDASVLAHAREAGVLVVSPRALGALSDRPPAIDALVFSDGDEREREWAVGFRPLARLVVRTRGADGGVWCGESSGSWPAVAPPAPVRDSYGCGDSFAAAFTLGLAEGHSVADAVASGARSGALCLTRPGAP
jgi:ribokinase